VLDYIRKNQTDLVLKPSDRYGGTGVTLEWEVDRQPMGKILGGSSSRREIGERGTACWIVQERSLCGAAKVPHPIGAQPEKLSFGTVQWWTSRSLHVRGKVACGFLTRLSASSLANVTSGGGQIPCLPRRQPKRAEKSAPGKEIHSDPRFGVAQKSGKIMKMSFGNAPIELMAGAENAPLDVLPGCATGRTCRA